MGGNCDDVAFGKRPPSVSEVIGLEMIEKEDAGGKSGDGEG